MFVVALAGTWHVGDLRPYRAVFFTFSSYEGKMRMVHNAMKARYGANEEIMGEWKDLRDGLNGFNDLRNKVAHLTPTTKPSPDPNAKAHARLIPPFWKSLRPLEFEGTGYSADELWQALAPYWGYHPRIHGLNPPNSELSSPIGSRLQALSLKLGLPVARSSPSAP